MSFDNIEIEKKYKVSKTKFNKIKEDLIDLASFVSDSNHRDEYYSIDENLNIDNDSPPIKWVSVRHRGGLHFLNYKRFIPAGVPDYTHSREYETKLDNPVAISKFLKDFGFGITVIVSKRRLSLSFKNLYEIALDEVDELGYFIEIEAKTLQIDIKTTNDKIVEFAGNLGLTEENRVNLGYPIQILRNKNKQ